MRKIIYHIVYATVLLITSCIVKDIPSPSKNDINTTSLDIFENSILEENNLLYNAIIRVCSNDTIYKEIYRLSGNGLDNYYWVPFVVLDFS